MIRQVDLAWVALGTVDERRERPWGDQALRGDRIQREVAAEEARRARAAIGPRVSERPALRPSRSGAF